VSAQARRALVERLVERGLSMRRACVLLSVARSMVGYAARQPAKDRPLLALLRRVARQHPRFGYRRAWAWLRRRGYRVNRKRVHRLWQQAGLALPTPRRRRKWRSGEHVVPVAGAPNVVWAADILYARGGDGRVVRCLCVVDEYTRECLAIVAGPRLASADVVRCLAGLLEQYGTPVCLRTDNGTEFVARRTQAWLATQGIRAVRIAPGQPWQNGVVESFHSRLRDECLNREWFGSPAEAAVILEQFRQTYNRTHLHSSVGYRTPAEVRADAETKEDSPSSQEERQR
jgi:putative transposase